MHDLRVDQLSRIIILAHPRYSSFRHLISRRVTRFHSNVLRILDMIRDNYRRTPWLFYILNCPRCACYGRRKNNQVFKGGSERDSSRARRQARQETSRGSKNTRARIRRSRVCVTSIFGSFGKINAPSVHREEGQI